MQSRPLVFGAVAATLVAAACGSTSSVSSSPPPSPAATGTTIAVASNSKLGQILVDGAGKTVYLFVADSGSSSTCYTTRTDGKTEVTYAGHPLYYFVQDKQPGDATGQGVNGFGGLWWVLSPSGAAVH